MKIMPTRKNFYMNYTHSSIHKPNLGAYKLVTNVN